MTLATVERAENFPVSPQIGDNPEAGTRKISTPPHAALDPIGDHVYDNVAWRFT
jgi:hypothetical protein